MTEYTATTRPALSDDERAEVLAACYRYLLNRAARRRIMVARSAANDQPCPTAGDSPSQTVQEDAQHA